MRYILFSWINLISLSGYCQDAVDYVVLGLIRIGVEENKMPQEIVNKKDSINYPNKIVVVQGTMENGLNNGAFTTFGDVSYAIWSEEELFVRDPYWIIPAKIKRNKSKISFDFTTTYLGTNKSTCYKGTIKGKILLKGKWMVTKCTYRSIACRFDLKQLAEESSTR